MKEVAIWESGTYRGRSAFGHKDPDVLPLQPDSWLSDVLHKMAPGDNSSLDADTHEIEEDSGRAALDHPFLGMPQVKAMCEPVLLTWCPVDPSIEPTAHDYHHIVWYPGMRVVQRRKQAYLDSHPHIRALSDLHLQSGKVSD